LCSQLKKHANNNGAHVACIRFSRFKIRETLTWNKDSDVASTLHSIGQAFRKANAPCVPAFAIHALFVWDSLHRILPTRALLLFCPQFYLHRPFWSKVITTCGHQKFSLSDFSISRASHVSLVEEPIRPRSHATLPRATPRPIPVHRGTHY